MTNASPELTVDYWRLTGALGRATRDDDAAHWTVVTELCKEFPEFDWHNAMTDSNSQPREVEVYIDEMRHVVQEGDYNLAQIRRFAHPPISDDYDVFWVPAHGFPNEQHLLKGPEKIRFDCDGAQKRFITKDRRRP